VGVAYVNSPTLPPLYGRVKLAELEPGDVYFGVYSATGRCIYRTRSENEANEIAARNPERLEVTQHVRGCGRRGCDHQPDSAGVPICGIGAAG
jgi:hypothetical protein